MKELVKNLEKLKVEKSKKTNLKVEFCTLILVYINREIGIATHGPNHRHRHMDRWPLSAESRRYSLENLNHELQEQKRDLCVVKGVQILSFVENLSFEAPFYVLVGHGKAAARRKFSRACNFVNDGLARRTTTPFV